MSKPLLIQGGRLIAPGQGIDRLGSFLIAEGAISWLGEVNDIPPQADYDVIPARGMVVCLGFIDLHCHLRDPGYEDKETIASGTRAAARGGFTTICCMPNTNPPLDNAVAIERVKSRAASEGIVRVLPIGCVTMERKGEDLAPLSELAEAGVIGYSDDGDPVRTSGLMRRALEQSHELTLPIIDHCEDLSLFNGWLINEGAVSDKLGVPGEPAVAEEIIVARDLMLAELTGGWVHIAHVSSAGSVEFIRRAKEKGIRVTAEVTPHHLTLTEEKVLGLDTNAKVNPPLRTEKDIQALIAGLKEGVIDIIATDHAPHTEVEKAAEFSVTPSGFSAFETTLGSLMALVHDGKLTLGELISRLTSEPAKILGGKFSGLGTLATGAPADVVIFDPDKEWVVDPDNFASKGKNTPIAGSVLKGKVMATIAGGKLVYKHSSITVVIS